MPTRRDLLQLGGGALLGASVLAGIGAAGAASDGGPSRELDGPHEQSGILGRQPRHVAIAAIDLDGELRGRYGQTELTSLLRDWTAAGRKLMRGEPVPAALGLTADVEAPADTGETAGLSAAGLTLTFGFGHALLDPSRGLIDGMRSGWAGKRGVGAQTAAIPSMRGDALQRRWDSGDLVVVAAADDPQVAVHAIRALLRIGRGAVSLRSLQTGFLPESGDGETPRNLFGFKDGTGNPDVGDRAVSDRMLWASEPAWLRGGGTYLVVRRIAMDLALWDATSSSKHEATFGRERDSGAPIGQRGEFDAPNLQATGSDGAPLIDPRSHVGLAHSAARAGQQILRRPWSYLGGADSKTGDLDAGLLFLSYQRSVTEQFVPLQRALADGDLLSEYVQAIGSAVYALPPAPRDGRGWIGRSLLA